MNNIMYLKNKIVNKFKAFTQDESGMGVVEIVLIILVLVGLAVMFRTSITSIVNSSLTSIKTRTNGF